jgi:hypothetical protein
LAKLKVPPAVCEPIYVNQVVRIALFTAMPTLDDVNIALMQRGDQSCGVVIPGAGSLDSIAGSHGQGGGPAGGCGGVLASGSPPRPWSHPGRWPRRQPRWWFWPRSGPDKGKDKHARVIHDDDEVSLTRMSLYRSGCDCFPVPEGRAGLPLPHPMKQPQ